MQTIKRSTIWNRSTLVVNATCKPFTRKLHDRYQGDQNHDNHEHDLRLVPFIAVPDCHVAQAAPASPCPT